VVSVQLADGSNTDPQQPSDGGVTKPGEIPEQTDLGSRPERDVVPTVSAHVGRGGSKAMDPYDTPHGTHVDHRQSRRRAVGLLCATDDPLTSTRTGDP
jgi:hypothetical protein